MATQGVTENLEIPQGVEVKVDGVSVSVKGPKGDLLKVFKFPNIYAKVDGGNFVIETSKVGKKEKKLIGTMRAHIKNMFKGVQEPHIYRMKICSGHFPMNVSASGDTLTVKNFLGEKVPRVIKLKSGPKVKIEGQEITIESPDIELAGQVAAAIEQLCRITNRDIRIFQDGIYITKKPGKD